MKEDARRSTDATECGFLPGIGIYPLPEGLRISVVVPVYNERGTVAELIRRVRAVPIPKEIILVDDASTDGTRERAGPDRAAATTSASSTTSGTAAKARPCGPVSPRPPATSSSSRTPTWNTTPAVSPADPADRRGHGRRGLRLAIPARRAAPRALLLALGGQPRSDDAVEYLHRSEPDRHGDLLQGVPPRGDPGHPADA